MLSLRNKLFIFLLVLLLLNLTALVLAYYQSQAGNLPSFTLTLWHWQWVLNPALFFLTKIGLGIGLLFTVALWWFYYLTRPLKYKIEQLQDSVHQIEQEDYHPVHQFVGQDEFSKLGDTFNRIMRTLSDKQAHCETLTQLISPILVQEAIANDLKKTLHKKMTILHLHIQGIEQYYNQVPAKRLLYLINNYFTRVNYCIENQQGITLHYAGNHLLSVHGLQQNSSQHPQQALLSAIHILNAVALFNIEEGQRNKITFQANIGISTGKVVAGNMGAYNHHQYALMGDAVDLAQVLPQFARHYQVAIILDQSMLTHLQNQPKSHHQKPYLYRQLDMVRLDERVTHLRLFELLNVEVNERDTIAVYLRRYEHAWQALHQQQFTIALDILQALAQDWSKDMPTRLLLQRCQHYVDDEFAYENAHVQGAYQVHLGIS